MTNGLAIVGIGGLFPAGPGLEAFWSTVRAGRSAIAEVPRDRWILDPTAIHDGSGAADTVISTRGGYVDPRHLVLDELPIDREWLDSLDPTVHFALHAGHQAWADACTEPLDPRRVGVILGNIALPTERLSQLSWEILGAPVESVVVGGRPRAARPGNPGLLQSRHAVGLPTALLAQALGLRGPAFALDAACASSLFAVQLAAEELLSGRLDAVLAGGMARPDSLYTQMGFTQLRALSPTGTCTPFDASANGLVVGEGAGVFVIKRLEDAIDHGDRIYAVVTGWGLSNDVDGRLLSPSAEGQLRAMRAAYRRAGWKPWDVGLIECHATGTPVGDATELRSLQQLWAEHPRGAAAVLGGVKSNVGHLLTGAGAAGLMKVLFALRDAALPPTAGFQRAADDSPLHESPFEVLTEERPWTSADGPRRAAVSGFGFGGTNAHVLLEEYRPRTVPRAPKPAFQPAAIAIVGLGARLADCTTPDELRARLLGTADPAPQSKARNWGLPTTAALRGWGIDELRVPLRKYRIPPREMAEMLPQQLAMLEAATAAIDDARGTPADGTTTGVFVGIGLDPHTTDYHLRWSVQANGPRWAQTLGLSPDQSEPWIAALADATCPALNADRVMGSLGAITASRIAREHRLGGPAYVLCSEEGSGLTALEAAVRSLQAGDIDAALVGAVDMTGDGRTLTAADTEGTLSRHGQTQPFSEHADGTQFGEGATCLLLKRLDLARAHGDRVYAVIQGAASNAGHDAMDDAVDGYVDVVRRACTEAAIEPADLDYIETHGSAVPHEDALERSAWSRLRDEPPLAGALKSRVGHTGAASGLVSVVRAALALHHRVIPGGGESARSSEGIRFAECSRYWLRDAGDPPRRSGVSCFAAGGRVAHVVLEEADPAPLDDGWATFSEGLFPVSGSSRSALVAALARLIAHADGDYRDIHQAAAAWWHQAPRAPEDAVAVALIARDVDDLKELARRARGVLEDTEVSDAEVARRLDAVGAGRIHGTMEPLCGGVAFVYPGSGNQFPGMGAGLSGLFPSVLERQFTTTPSLRSQIAPETVWDATSDVLDADPAACIRGQVAVGAILTDVATDLGIRPSAAIGYSLGESTALFALRAWKNRHEMYQRMTRSTLFTDDLAGPCMAVRAAWRLEPHEPVHWSVGVVHAPAERVRAELTDRTYLLIVNTPDECVVGGHGTAINALARRLGVELRRLRGVTTVHCEVVAPVAEEYRQLHIQQTTPPEGIRFYSGAWGRHYPVTAETAADALLAMATGGVDFPKTIQAAYEDGARLFLELGPGSSCTRMIQRILQDRPHVVRPTLLPGRDPMATLMRAVAALFAHRIPIDLTPWYPARPDVMADEPALTVEVGRGTIEIPQIPVSRTREISPTRPTRPKQPSITSTPEAGGAVNARQELPLTAGVQAATGATPAVPTPRMPMSAAPAPAAQAPIAASETRPPLRDETARAHETFLRLSRKRFEMLSQATAAHMQMLSRLQQTSRVPAGPSFRPGHSPVGPVHPVLDRDGCVEFARGSIERALGPRFAGIDAYPTRVRLPDGPLMLVDRIVHIDAEPLSMKPGRLTTEHDVHARRWYLDQGRIPTGVCIEAGQADLFLSGYVGIDHETRGEAVYRLLDAAVTYHRGLPKPGETIAYDIEIKQFFQKSGSWFFRFQFDARTADGPLMTMRDGLAGFFTEEMLAAGRGIARSRLTARREAGRCAPGVPVVPLESTEHYDDRALDALRRGDLDAAFGPRFANLELENPPRLPGGELALIDRIGQFDPNGGRYGLGLIRSEKDIDPDAWFLVCHFVDDPVMPGTLMYESCLQTLRAALMRLGWVADASETVWEPIPGVTGRLNCRGQVTGRTRQARYEVHIKELGYNPAPYAIADAFMFADDRPIVEITDMPLQLTGATEEMVTASFTSAPATIAYDRDHILALAQGRPSDAFGERYRAFDEARRCARLPRPPYSFLDRIVSVTGRPLEFVSGNEVVGEHDVAPDAWYFEESRNGLMPLAVLQEAALQPCGWLAAYIGSALTSETDLKFRNLGGTATLHRPVDPHTRRITTRAKMTGLAKSGDTIILHYDFAVTAGRDPVYTGTTYFGFFTEAALADQVGLPHVQPWTHGAGESFPIPHGAPYPAERLRMLDRIEHVDAHGGPHGLGLAEASKVVRPDEWFFEAHFLQDPVWPGSLGLEAFAQLLRVLGVRRWGTPAAFDVLAPGRPHTWSYRGQVLPTNERVTLQAAVTEANDHALFADGWLAVDGLPIYEMKQFGIMRGPQ